MLRARLSADACVGTCFNVYGGLKGKRYLHEASRSPEDRRRLGEGKRYGLALKSALLFFEDDNSRFTNVTGLPRTVRAASFARFRIRVDMARGLGEGNTYFLCDVRAFPRRSFPDYSKIP